MIQINKHNIWNPEMETISRNDLEVLQLSRLKSLVERVSTDVTFYKEAFSEKGITPDSIKSLDDLKRLPFTTKHDLRKYFPYGMLAVPLKKVVRIHASSGTTGKPTVVAYTAKDLDTWSELIARLITAAGVTDEDIVHVSFGYGLFTGGFGLHYGAEKVGASVIPVSSGNSERQIRIMQDFGSTVLVSTPSYSLYLAEVMEEMGVDPAKDLKLRIGLYGGESWSESIRNQIESKLGISATDNYGLSEVIGPGVSGECEVKNGMHIFEDHFIVELIDPETEEVITTEGRPGELVFTSLTKEAFPIIRYRTRDICTLDFSPCKCGRTLVRMSKIMGRSDDMLIIRGVNIYPSQIEEILLGIEEIEPHYLLIIRREGAMDTLEIQVEVSEKIFSDEMKMMRSIQERLFHKLQTSLGISPVLKLVEPKTIERSTGKAKRVLDLRK